MFTYSKVISFCIFDTFLYLWYSGLMQFSFQTLQLTSTV